ncbi:hypothetical protein ABZS98_16145 [Streptomyces avermitilis]|uniref:hypothetical protein n=1 Tax=Streptomyces avermitilis TaxID=33903 RepID=UPI0033BF1F4D
MSGNLTAAFVAVIGILGTLAAPITTQRSAARAKKQEFDLQRQGRAEERAHEDQRAELAEKRALYAALNQAVRTFRAAVELYVQDLLDQAASPGPALDVLDEPRRAYQIEYARAQMLLPEHPMIITSEINRSFNSAYRVLAQLQKNYDADKAAELQQWLYDGLSEAAWVHRQVLRHDLGVDKPISDFQAALRMLQDTRKASIDRGIANRGLGIDAVGGYTSGVQPPGA